MSALLDQLQSIVDQLRAAEGVTPTTADWRAETGFPKVKEVDGIRLILNEPINPQWRPSTSARIYGGQFSGPSGINIVLADPSNGNGSTQFPRRTYWGWPIHYGQGMGGALVGPGVVVHEDASIDPPTDVAVEAYFAKDAERKKNQEESQALLDARPK